MIRTLLTTTALALLLATPAMAQDAATPAAGGTMQPGNDYLLADGYTGVDTDSLATRIMGQPVYSSAANDAENIGEINDLVINADGSIQVAVIGVGGFLGIGEKNVAVDFNDLEFVIAADNTERWVLGTTREALDTAPAFEWMEDEPTDSAMVDPNAPAMAPADPMAPVAPVDQTAAAPVDPNAPAANTGLAPADQVAVTPVDPNANAMSNEMAATTETAANPNATAAPMGQMNREGMMPMEGELTADNLMGTQIIGPQDEVIAEVGDIVLTADGQVDALLVDFGGFLGLGQKRVAVGVDNLEFMSDAGGIRYVWLNITREQLEAAPEYNEATYGTDANQRLVTTNM